VRVIAGVYRGRKLRTAHGWLIRPTSDRLRETLFNIIAPRIQGARFLDICAGSGAVGIEALSRGAGHVTFIDRSQRACAVIRGNLDVLGIKQAATIINRDAVAAIDRLAAQSKKFDIAFFDPPYESELYRQVMGLLATADVLADDPVVVVEHRAKMPPDVEYGELRLYREVKQGESALAFYGRI
jgi:16S rRNA (guanine966-N2)-methyltransferase